MSTSLISRLDPRSVTIELQFLLKRSTDYKNAFGTVDKDCHNVVGVYEQYVQ